MGWETLAIWLFPGPGIPLSVNCEKLPIKVFDNLYQHVSKEEHHNILMKIACGRHAMNSKRKSKIHSMSPCLPNMYFYHQELRATKGYDLTYEPQTLETVAAFISILLLKALLI